MLAKLAPISREVIDKNSFTISNRRSNTTRSFQKFRLESKWNATFLFVPAENFWEQRNIWKGSPVFPDEMFFKLKFVFLFIKVTFDTSFGPSRPLLGKLTDLYKWNMRFWNEIHRFAWPCLCSHAVLCVSFTYLMVKTRLIRLYYEW